jgi:predicted ATPase/DNA-binding winged helix-turn-helix (wHTH) protein
VSSAPFYTKPAENTTQSLTGPRGLAARQADGIAGHNRRNAGVGGDSLFATVVSPGLRSGRKTPLGWDNDPLADDQNRDQPISFGPFRLFPKARLLEKGGVPLQVGGRALDILIFLAGRPGEVVDKRQLMKQVWADVNVDEGSLRFHITGLRKALGGTAGSQYVKNVPGRGYCFAAQPISSEPSGSPNVSANCAHLLPPRMAKLFGRTDAIEKISSDILQWRTVTVVGPGGIGKTSVATDVAHRHLEAFEEQVFFVDFGALTDTRLVPGAIVSALGLTVNSEDPVPNLLAFLRERHALLILDSCEHVLDVLAPLVEQIAREAPESHVLATSREALRIESERVFRLSPLNFPPPDAPFTTADILAYPATQLFAERVAASSGRSELSEEETPLIADICRRLDGIPLAIELAAGRVNAYGVAGTASLLDGHMSLLWRGRRTAIPRHQTLSATLAWSYNLLSDVESATLRRLSTFSGPFTLEAAIAVACSQHISEAEAAEAIASLVSKSLISAPSGRPLRYRLLDATRAFAREKLVERGETDQAARAHAQYFCEFLKQIADRPGGVPGDGRFFPHADQVSNIRVALDWSLSAQGDKDIGVSLAASAGQFFLELSLLTECHRWTQQAVGLLEATSTGGRQEMALRAALGASLMVTQGNSEVVRSSLQRGVQLAEQLGDRFWQLWILRLLQIFHTRIGDFQGSLDAGKRGETVAKLLDDPASALYVQWALGIAHHMIGNQQNAVELCESALVQNPGPQSQTLHFGYDNRIFALFALARGLWLTGQPDRAVEVASFTIGEAERLEQPLSLSLAFVFTIPVFLWGGDWDTAELMIERFIDCAARHGFGTHHAVGIGLKGVLLIRRGDIAGGIDHLHRSKAILQAARYRMMFTTFGIAEAEALVQLHQLEDALRVIDECISSVGERGESFDMPEMYRVKGYILHYSGRAAEAENCLHKSLELSRKQCALGWELRAALTLGHFWLEGGRAADARALIEPLYNRYEGGLGGVDLIAAKRFLGILN